MLATRGCIDSLLAEPLEKKLASAPNNGRSPHHGEKHFGDHGLHQKQQERAEKYGGVEQSEHRAVKCIITKYREKS